MGFLPKAFGASFASLKEDTILPVLYTGMKTTS